MAPGRSASSGRRGGRYNVRMSVVVGRCRVCTRSFPLERSRSGSWLRASLVALPFLVLGGAAALRRPDFLVLAGLGVAVLLLARALMREPCPHCHSLRTRPRRIRYLTVVR